MPDLLFLAQRLPYPPDKGEKIRAYHEVKLLARWFDIHLGCLVDDPTDMEHVETLRPLCRSIYAAPINRRFGRLHAMWRALHGSALSVGYFHNRGLARWVRQTMRTVRPAVTFVYSSNMAPYVLELPRVGARVVDLVDVDSEKWRVLAARARGPMQIVYRREWRKIWNLEQRVAREADVSILVSAAEADLFAHIVSDHTLICDVSNGVDCDYFDPERIYPAPFDIRFPTFVFTGTMDYPPNIDAVVWFATDILPRIRRCVPLARFAVVGSNPTVEVERLGRIDGVSITGRVPDTRPYLAHATAAVAPMRIARGIQNKVLEAMAMGRPTVVTSGALEGITAVPGRDLMLADNEDDFAAACAAVTEAQVGRTISRSARARVLADYNWEIRLAPLVELLSPTSAPRYQMTQTA
jgi:polysaccharide biosynthesis protein PslH